MAFLLWLEILLLTQLAMGHHLQPHASKSTPKFSYAAKGSANGKDAIDKCHLHLFEYQDCQDEGDNLSARLLINDARGKEILLLNESRIGINAGNPGYFKSVLPHEMVITGEHRGNYVQFTMGDLSFKSTDELDPDNKHQKAWCGVGGWDPKNLHCAFKAQKTRQIDCYFDCPYDS